MKEGPFRKKTSLIKEEDKPQISSGKKEERYIDFCKTLSPIRQYHAYSPIRSGKKFRPFLT